MATTLLTTKLYVPHVLPAFVPRPRITERLSVGLAGKLTLITAPAGFGKTTAVSAWLVPEAGAIRLALQEAPTPPIEAVLTTLINTLSHVSRQIVLVLDDYHVIG